MPRLPLIATFLIAFTACHAAEAQLPSFPGAEGYGGAFTGSAPAGGWFSNASVYHVTTTADAINPSTGKPAVGTLRGAFYDYANPNSPKQGVMNRVVVFDVGGTFQLTQGSLDIKSVNNIYIAGQTAPSPVVVYGNTTQITKSNNTLTSNVILRYMTFRKGTGDGEDAITFAGGSGAGDTVATNMILDHVSASWAEDEDLSVANNNTNVSVQYSIIADALTATHAYGSLIRPQIDSNVSFHHNLYANNVSRQARFGTYNAETLTADFRNNVIYNWRDRASYTGGSSEPEREFTDVNYVGNYLIAGPGTLSNANKAYTVDKNVDTRVYQSGNLIDSDKAVNPGGVPNGSDLGWGAFQLGALGSPAQTLTQLASPLDTAPVTTQSALAAYDQVLNYVGNSWWSRDAIDSRVVNNVVNNTGPPSGVGAAAPNSAELAGVTGAASTARPAGWDTDGDGMPDAWELARGLNPNSAADGKLDFDNDGYINVVEYLNEMGEVRAPAPIRFTGATNNRYAQITNWRTSDGLTAGSNWQPGRADAALIDDATVVVDAIGQRAGNVLIANSPSSTATMNVTAGRLDILDNLIIGAGGTGLLNQTGGIVTADHVILSEFGTGVGEYVLSGGELRTHGIDKGPGASGALQLTGGILSADMVGFDLVNQGAVIAPGDVVGSSHIAGDLKLQSGALEIDIGGHGALEYDRLLVDGMAALGGTLRVRLVDLGGGTYVPQLGDSFGFLAASGGASGMFSSFDLPALTPGLAWSLNPGNVTVFLSVVSSSPNPADFNSDGHVDAADLTVWQAGFGLAGQTNHNAGDANGDGLVDGADFLVWQQNISASAPAAPAPEPCSMLLAIVLLPLFRRTHRHAIRATSLAACRFSNHDARHSAS